MSQTKIAVIEDDAAIQYMYKYKLQREGYRVKTALNGEQGLELIQSFCPSLILLDIRMPIMDGVTMLKKLRSIPGGTYIKVVILTNISRDEAPSELRLLDIERYVVKAHHTPAQVVDIIREVLCSKN